VKIIGYTDFFRDQVITLILHIQNDEARINLSLEKQPDLLDIKANYLDSGGCFWIAVEDNEVIGTIALMNMGGGHGLLKKFFVRENHRGKGVGLALYGELKRFAETHGFRDIMLDTPTVAKRSHSFYERAGFVRIDKTQAPFEYEYPHKESYLYLLEGIQDNIIPVTK